MKPRDWISALCFGLIVYAAGLAVGTGAARAAPWLAPLPPALCALAVFGAWRRARGSRQHLRLWREALQSVGLETANAVNAIRANLLDFRRANPDALLPEHLEEIEAATRRIAAALKNAENPTARRARSKSQPPLE